VKEEKYRFLDSSVKDPEGPEFHALGSTQEYQGLEIFPNPGCVVVTYTCDEIVSVCPMTGQPDYYEGEIQLIKCQHLVESKSLKLWLTELHKSSIMGEAGMFCESLANHIASEILDVIRRQGEVRVTLTQKSRGGISIKATAWSGSRSIDDW
jgi:7-cyano-7-deazaguanine reductase